MESGTSTNFERNGGNNCFDDAFTVGKMLYQGKSKKVYDIKSRVSGRCLIVTKDIISSNNGARQNNMDGKATLSTAINGSVMQILNVAGVKSAYIKSIDQKTFLAWKCSMIPIEWVARRFATGSFLRRHSGVQEGYRFYPPKMETFFKDDENDDPQWSREVLEEAKLECGGVIITPGKIDIMEKMTVAIFEILERAWNIKDVSLVDMKIEFGVREDTKEIVLADVIDNDTWRIWPKGDKTQMKDIQVYRNLKQVTVNDIKNLRENYKWVLDQLQDLSYRCQINNGFVQIVMGSVSDKEHCNKIKSACEKLGMQCGLHVSSPHKSTDATLKWLAQIEGQAVSVPTVIIAVAGRSNGLGPVLSGNTVLPVINCPPMSAQWGSSDVWSSLRLPSGLGCATVLRPDAAALAAGQILAHHNFSIWGKIRSQQLNNWIALMQSNDLI